MDNCEVYEIGYAHIIGVYLCIGITPLAYPLTPVLQPLGPVRRMPPIAQAFGTTSSVGFRSWSLGWGSFISGWSNHKHTLITHFRLRFSNSNHHENSITSYLRLVFYTFSYRCSPGHWQPRLPSIEVPVASSFPATTMPQKSVVEANRRCSALLF